MIEVSGRDDPDVASPGTAVEVADRPVVYPVFGSWSRRRFELAAALAAGAETDLIVLDVAADRSRSESARGLAGSRFRGESDARDVDVHTLAPDGDPSQAVTAVVERFGAGLVLLGEETPDSLTDLVRGDVTERVPCDAVAVAKLRETPTIASILVPVADGPHSGVSVRVAGALARATDAWVELMHVSAGDGADERRAERLFADARTHIPADVDVDTWHLDASDPAETIVEQSRHYDVTVVGSPQKGRLRRFLFGSTAGEITSEAENTVFTAHRGDVRFFG
jgi:nucleotide-binding universal stress UspA family protein